MKKLLLSALMLAAVTFTVNAQTAADKASATTEKAEHGKHKGKEIYKDLALTDDQKAKMKEIHKDAKAKKEAIKNNTSLNESQKQEEFKKLKMDNAKQSEALLTPEQKTKLQAAKKAHKGKKAA